MAAAINLLAARAARVQSRPNLSRSLSPKLDHSHSITRFDRSRTGPKLLILDELRRNVEALGPGAYEQMDYYERWIAAIAAAMIERGVVTTEELGRKMAEVEARYAAEQQS